MITFSHGRFPAADSGRYRTRHPSHFTSHLEFSKNLGEFASRRDQNQAALGTGRGTISNSLFRWGVLMFRIPEPRRQPLMDAVFGHWGEAEIVAGVPIEIVPGFGRTQFGTFTVAMLQAAHDAIDAKLEAIETADQVTLPLDRVEKERFFGDVPDDERDDESVVARMLLYVAGIESRFPGEPIAQTLPEVFPPETATTVPTFGMNWVMQPGSVLKLWFERPSVSGGVLIAIQEGVVEQTQPLDAGSPGDIEVTTWTGIVVVNEIDDVEIRNGDGVTIARGMRNTALPEPVGV